MGRERRVATAALLVMTVIWGATFSWMKLALDAAADQLGPEAGDSASALFLTFRFAVAAIVLPMVLPGARRGLGAPELWRGGALLSAMIVAGFALQMMGLQEIDPATSAFLTSLYVLFTALIIALRKRALPGRFAVLGVLLATFGAGFIGGPPHLSFGVPELLTVLCALAFAGHILLTDHVTKRVDALAVTTTSFVLTALACAGLLAVAMVRDGQALSPLLGLLSHGPFLWPALLCALLGTVTALTLLNLFQKALSPLRAAILYSLEPVWAAMIALALGQTSADPWFLIGASALLAGNIVMELAPKKG